MKKLTPQILGMYLMCQVEIVDQTRDGKIDTLVSLNAFGDCAGNEYEWRIDKCRPILRRLSDMTEEEARELYEVVLGAGKNYQYRIRKIGSTYEVCSFDPEDYKEDYDDDSIPSDDQIFEDADYNENLMRIELKPTFNIWKGWEHDFNEVYELKTQFKSFAYLLSKRFDLFGLIDSGEAIDAKTLAPPTEEPDNTGEADA